MDIFKTLEQRLDAMRMTGTCDSAFDQWRADSPALQRFRNFDHAFATCRDPDARPEDQDAFYLALCGQLSLASTIEQPCGMPAVAGVVLMAAFVPALRHVFAQLSPRSTLDREDLAAELYAGLWEAACDVAPATTFVGRRLVQSAKRKAIRCDRHAASVHRREQPLASTEEGHSIGEFDLSPLFDVMTTGVITPLEAELVSAPIGELQAAAARHGLSYETAKKRRQAACARLREWIRETL